MTNSRTGQNADLHDRLRAVRGVIFDIDGCLVLADRPGGHGGRPLPGAVEAVAAVRRSGRSVVAFTNGSSQVPAEIAANLRALGFDLDDSEVLTPSVVAADIVLQRFGDNRVLAFGGHGLVDVLEDAGVALCEIDRPQDACAVVIGWDVNFDRDRLQAAAEAVWSGAPLLVTSDARRFASATRPMAGVGGFIAKGLSYVTDTRYEVVGKPSAAAMSAAARRLGVSADEILVAGDDLTLEIAMARSHNAVGVLVTTGLHGHREVLALSERDRPDLVVESLSDLIAAWALAEVDFWARSGQ